MLSLSDPRKMAAMVRLSGAKPSGLPERELVNALCITDFRREHLFLTIISVKLKPVPLGTGKNQIIFKQCYYSPII